MTAAWKAGPNPAEVPRVLIVRVGAMGDVLHALPAVAALRRARPEALLGWAIDPRWLPLLSASDPVGTEAAKRRSGKMPIVDRCFLADTSLWKQSGVSVATATSVCRLARALRGERFRTCVDMQGSLRSAAIGRLCGASRLVGNSKPRERPAQWLYSDRLETPARHVVVQGCELLGGALGFDLTPAPVELPRDVEAEQWATTLAAGPKRVVLLAASAGWGAKQWPAHRFGAVARALTAEGFRVLVNAVSHGDEVAHQVIAASGGEAEWAVCSLSQLVALTRRSALVIAGDTGPLHLAAALGRPVVGLYGPTDPDRTGPWSTRSRVLRDPTSITDHKRHRTPEAGLLKIEVNHVMDAAWELLCHA